jgi:aryl-alcohol dehydrogenase-like predicted oxidoreductase
MSLDTAFDTSPYYGNSELAMGQALWDLRAQHPRDSYVLITKCGRKAYDDFDYSGSWIRESVLRSLARLRTGYLDVVLLHDAEFPSEEEVLEGMRELAKLRAEGLTRAIGLSGYSLPVLLSRAQAIQARLGFAADVFFSYCHFNLQNSLLAEYAPRFAAAGVKHLINGSPLSMGLLRAEPAPDWHPAPPALKAACVEASKHVESVHREKLADVAIRYSLGFDGTTCAGCSSLAELETVLRAWDAARERKQSGVEDVKDRAIFQELRHILAGEGKTVWPMPPTGFVRKSKG